MKYKKVVIIVLNYMNYQDTQECIESILKQEYADFCVLVVDNGSTNESYVYLNNLYKHVPKVSVIRVKKNLGFARGNNVGINYARRRLAAEYILLVNNDTIMTDKFYVKTLVENDNKGIGVIGSSIVQRDNKNKKRLYRYVTFPGTLMYYIKLLLEIIGFTGYMQFWEDVLSKYEGVYILQGCNLLLTPEYFGFYNGLDGRTFLYCEEELLYLRCKKVGLQQKIVEETSILHKCGRASQILYRKKRNIFLKYLLSSYKYVLWESIKNYGRDWLKGYK